MRRREGGLQERAADQRRVEQVLSQAAPDRLAQADRARRRRGTPSTAGSTAAGSARAARRSAARCRRADCPARRRSALKQPLGQRPRRRRRRRRPAARSTPKNQVATRPRPARAAAAPPTSDAACSSPLLTNGAVVMLSCVVAWLTLLASLLPDHGLADPHQLHERDAATGRRTSNSRTRSSPARAARAAPRRASLRTSRASARRVEEHRAGLEAAAAADAGLFLEDRGRLGQGQHARDALDHRHVQVLLRRAHHRTAHDHLTGRRGAGRRSSRARPRAACRSARAGSPGGARRGRSP